MHSVDKRRVCQDKDRGSRSEDRERSGAKSDNPPNSRLFIVCGKKISEEEFQEAFQIFGTIEEVWVLKDRGIAYVKFAKTSEAALAMETMNGRCIPPHPRPLKVMIANSRSQGSNRDVNETERCRLFLMVPKTMTEDELKKHFSEFGDVDYVSVVKDRNTNENKGFAYVKYHRMSHASRAFEECDRSFKPVFAEPKPNKMTSFNESGGGTPGAATGPGSTASSSSVSAYDMLSFMDASTTNPDGFCCLSVAAANSVNQDQIWRLFDIVPGLDYCERKQVNPRSNARGIPGKTLFLVVYNNPQSSAYAKEKLHGFEYPPGQRLSIKYDNFGENYNGRQQPTSPMHSSMGPPLTIPPQQQQQQQFTTNVKTNYDLAQLTETIANATALLQAAGYTAGGSVPPKVVSGTSIPTSNSTGETYNPSYCSVKLPPPQPLASMELPVAERLFFVCTVTPPPLYSLKDVFSRFGNLIDIYMLSGKNCGYAKYSDKDSADRAVAALHGQEICGSRLKVMTADPRDKNVDPAGRKRQKFES